MFPYSQAMFKPVKLKGSIAYGYLYLTVRASQNQCFRHQNLLCKTTTYLCKCQPKMYGTHSDMSCCERLVSKDVSAFFCFCLKGKIRLAKLTAGLTLSLCPAVPMELTRQKSARGHHRLHLPWETE